MLSERFSEKVYNDLLDVETCNEQVSGGILNGFLQEAGASISKYQADEYAGIFLLHRHNIINKDEIMVERDGVYNEKSALICAPEGCFSDAVPVRWGLVDNCFVPLEYGSDPILKSAYGLLKENGQMLIDLAAHIKRCGVVRNLGICLYDRSFFSNPPAGHIALEETDVAAHANIITWQDVEPDTSMHIQTTWNFEAKGKLGPGCNPVCSRRCVMRSPGHAIEHPYIHGIIG